MISATPEYSIRASWYANRRENAARATPGAALLYVPLHCVWDMSTLSDPSLRSVRVDSYPSTALIRVTG
jgi:hypothetical protein